MEEEAQKYRVIRLFSNERNPEHRRVVKRGLTLEQAKEHCRREDTRLAGVWFDGWEEDNGLEGLVVCSL